MLALPIYVAERSGKWLVRESGTVDDAVNARVSRLESDHPAPVQR